MDWRRMMELADAVEAAPHVRVNVPAARKADPVDPARMAGSGLEAFTMNAVGVSVDDDLSCGTAGCIAGWAMSLYSSKEKIKALQHRNSRGGISWRFDDVWTEVADQLDMRRNVAEALCLPEHLLGGDLKGISPKAAAAVLRRLVKMDERMEDEGVDGKVSLDDVRSTWTAEVAAETERGG